MCVCVKNAYIASSESRYNNRNGKLSNCDLSQVNGWFKEENTVRAVCMVLFCVARPAREMSYLWGFNCWTLN